jgi:NDP-sugar pyrophosphorylase family protein
MLQFSVQDFLDVEDWEHRSLFVEDEPVWSALGARLKEYLESWTDWSIETDVPDCAHVLGDRVSIGPRCKIEPGAVIIGPAIIGPDTLIRTGAYVRENVITGASCIIGAHSEAKGSILLPNARAPHQNYVGDSILGRNVNLGAGTICSNVKNIGREVTFRADGEVVHTGLRKFGAVLGDGCKTGCNTVLNPGVLMGPGSVTYPNASLRGGYYPAGTLVKVRQNQKLLEMDRITGRE